jgi:rfaE bifunctional protein kinase chain/domain
VVGDVLLDRDVTGTVERLCPDAPVPVLAETGVVERAGGAGLAAAFLARDGADVTLVAAVGADEAGDLVRALLAAAGVALVEIPYDGPTVEKIRLRAGHHPLLRLDRGTGPGRFGELPPAASDALATARAVLVSDYGRGVTALPALRGRLTAAADRLPLVWDPHPAGSTPVAGAALACPNRAEAAGFAATHGGGTDDGSAAAHATLLRRAWRVAAVAVTLGGHGAVLSDGERPPRPVPATPSPGDPCGAGDRFAAAATTALARGTGVAGAVEVAVGTASAFVAGHGLADLRPLNGVAFHEAPLNGTPPHGAQRHEHGHDPDHDRRTR